MAAVEGEVVKAVNQVIGLEKVLNLVEGFRRQWGEGGRLFEVCTIDHFSCKTFICVLLQQCELI